MLFFLSEQLVNQEYSTEKTEKINRAVEYVLKSVYESKHLVFADRATISLLKEKILNEDAKRILSFLDNNYSFLNYEQIKYFVNVIPDNSPMEVIIDGDKSILNLSINYFQTSDTTQETRILCEDPVDSDFFKEICNYYIKQNRIGNISLKFESEHGGGNQLSKRYTKHIKSKTKFCLAFCDTDKRYPNSPIGSTLKDLISVDQENNYLCSYISLDAHEIENLVPFNYLDEIKCSYNPHDGITFIKNILTSDHAELLKYYDIKKGVLKKNLCTNLEYRSFTKTLLLYCRNNIDLDSMHTLEDSYQIIPNLGKIIPSFLEKTDLIDRIDPYLLQYQSQEWFKIGSNFLYWTCARNSEAINF